MLRHDLVMKLLKILPLVAACSAAPAYAQSMFDELDPVDLSPTKVSIIDKATGGCWTNAGEVKSYAEDQLRLAGVEVVQDDISPISTSFQIRISAKRLSHGACVGSYSFEFGAPVEFMDKEVFGTLLIWNNWFQTPTNANIIVLDSIKESLSNEPFESR